ncbi:hypothetical protein NDU88_006963 [Pleurodeles waltl]|uniref:Uncharacterized protein n=1 Tax=Pleurodeles waltl TaxID=8319 RepID=A0AAV7RPI7_PLEWA|nr:hypothetical protein NDU88_006963 [Pleurodeles waltl]
MRLDIAGFQSRVLGLEQRVSTVETHITSFTDRDQELLYLRTNAATRLTPGSRHRKRSLKYPGRTAAPRESPVNTSCPGVRWAWRGAPAGGQTGSRAEFGGSEYQIAAIQDGGRGAVRLRNGAPSLL